jgi:hypothetical protein
MEIICVNKKFNREICHSTELAFCAVMKTLGSQVYPFIKVYIPLFLNLATARLRKKLVRTGVHLIGLVIYHCYESIDLVIVSSALKIALEEAESGNFVGFKCLKFIIVRFPGVIEEQSLRVSNLFRRVLSEEMKTRRIVENALTAFGRFVMCFGEEGFVDGSFLSRVIGLMPTEVDVEEMTETMVLYDWIWERGKEVVSLEVFAAVIVRLLGVGKEELKSAGFEEDAIRRYGQMLMGMIGMMEREKFCLTVLENDEMKFRNAIGILQEMEIS